MPKAMPRNEKISNGLLVLHAVVCGSTYEQAGKLIGIGREGARKRAKYAIISIRAHLSRQKDEAAQEKYRISEHDDSVDYLRQNKAFWLEMIETIGPELWRR